MPPEQRIAVFDNDGTLWCEKPMYIQLAYMIETLSTQAEQDPALRTRHYQGDDGPLHELMAGIFALAQDRAVAQLEAEARDFVARTHHPTLAQRYADCIYLPMVQLLRYLEDRGFINYIVSGGGRDFMRGFAAEDVIATAGAVGWTQISMAQDWSAVFADTQPENGWNGINRS